jgi:hypothetical protein
MVLMRRLMLVVLFVELVDVNFKRLNPFCPPGSGLGDKSTQLRGSVWRGLCVAGLALPPGRWFGAGRQVNPATGFRLAWAVRSRVGSAARSLVRGWATSQPSYGVRFGVGCA